MPTYNLATIRGAIKTILESVSSLAYVYDRRNPIIEGYPCAIFDITNNENDMLTNVENERKITYTIWLIQEVGIQGMTDANVLLDEITREAIENLESRANLTLGGLVDWIMPAEGKREEVSSPEGSAIWQVLNLDVRVTTSVV
jgi:hypothetical protein